MAKRQPPVITLLTDFGNQDAYAGIMKGVIAGINPFANIIDICHNIPPQDIFSGAYLLSSSYKYFPRGTIHVAVVDPGVGSSRDIVCVEVKGSLFIVPNNGLLSFIIREELPRCIVRVTNPRYFLSSPGNTFHGRDVFAPVAAHLSLGVKLHQLGERVNQLERLDIPFPKWRKAGQLEGNIIYIDRFGNLITNITKEHIAQQGHNHVIPLTSPHLQGGNEGTRETARKSIETTIGKRKIRNLRKSYMDVKIGEPLVLFGSTGFLEISVNQGNAQKHFHAVRGEKVTVRIIALTI